MQRIQLAALAGIIGLSSWFVPAAYAAAGPHVGVVFKVVSGKASQATAKHTVTELRTELEVGGEQVRLTDRFSYPTQVESSSGISTQYFNSGLTVSVRAQEQGAGVALFSVDVSDNTGVPRKGKSDGLAGGANVSGFRLDTDVVLELKKGKSVELGWLVDDLEDRSWLVSMTIADLRGAAAAKGSAPANEVFTATIAEVRKKKAKVTLRMAMASSAKANISHAHHRPVSVVSANGVNVQFFLCGVTLRMVAAKNPGSWNVDVESCRADGPKVFKQASMHRREVVRTLELKPGASVVLGTIKRGDVVEFEASVKRE